MFNDPAPAWLNVHDVASGSPTGPRTPLAPAPVEDWPMSVMVTKWPPVMLSELPTALMIRVIAPDGTVFSPAIVIVPGPVFVTVLVPSKTAHEPVRASV